MAEKSKIPMAYLPDRSGRDTVKPGPYSGVNAMVDVPALHKTVRKGTDYEADVGTSLSHRFAVPDRPRSGGGGVAEQRRAAQLRKNRQHASILFVVVMLGTMGYHYESMPNCIQTTRGLCAYAFTPSIGTQEMCAAQACRAYEYSIQKNFDWSKYTKEMQRVTPRPTPAHSTPPADGMAWSASFAQATSALGDFLGWNTAPQTLGLGEGVHSGSASHLNLDIDPASEFDPAEFAREWQMRQMFGDYHDTTAAEAAAAVHDTTRIYAEAEWTQKGVATTAARTPTGFAPSEKMMWSGYVEDDAQTLDYTCTIGCNLLKDIPAQRRCLDTCKNKFQSQ